MDKPEIVDLNHFPIMSLHWVSWVCFDRNQPNRPCKYSSSLVIISLTWVYNCLSPGGSTTATQTYFYDLYLHDWCEICEWFTSKLLSLKKFNMKGLSSSLCSVVAWLWRANHGRERDRQTERERETLDKFDEAPQVDGRQWCHALMHGHKCTSSLLWWRSWSVSTSACKE